MIPRIPCPLLVVGTLVVLMGMVGTETGGSTVEEFANRLRTESEQFAKVIKQINLKLD
jgi:hypothetical protein